MGKQTLAGMQNKGILQLYIGIGYNKRLRKKDMINVDLGFTLYGNSFIAL